MKSYIISISLLFFLVIIEFPVSFSNVTGDVETTKFKVEGVCDMCKERIENGALIKGVKKAEWNKDTSMITIIYDPEKVSLVDIHKAIAEVGHSTDKVKAEKSVYGKLPACCQYAGGTQKH